MHPGNATKIQPHLDINCLDCLERKKNMSIANVNNQSYTLDRLAFNPKYL